MPRIVIESGPQRGKIFELPSDTAPVNIGRDVGCALLIPDARVSRVHFVVAKHGKKYVLQDRSRNGTFINGQRVDRSTLRQGDMIRLGQTFLSFFEERQDPYLGKTIARYRIEHRLGRGAMGTVYRAVQVSLDRTVALKILSKELTEDDEYIRQFLRECRSVGKLNHPNVVQIHDAGHADDVFYIAMEYMAGGSLQNLMDREGRLPPSRVLRWSLDALKALMWAEDQGIVHRDIKPDNLMLDDRNVLKIGDFGIAADNRRSKTLVEGGKVVGTPLYMAPEQAMGKPVDHRVDIYALGSTLYTAMSGQFPYDGETSTEILVKKCKERPRPLAVAAPDLPKRVVALVEKAIEIEPDDRFQSASELYREISDVYETVKGRDDTTAIVRMGAGTARARPGLGTTRRIFSDTRWKKRSVYAAIVIAALGLAGVLIWQLL